MTTETPIEIEPRDWQDILGYMRALEERVMNLAAQVASLETRLTRDEADRDKADLKAQGYLPHGPGGEAEEIDRMACAAGTCPSCGHEGLGYEPWVRNVPHSYVAYAVCHKCGHREEF